MKKSKPKFIKREPESPEIIKRRWDFKKEQIEVLANNIQKLRYNVTLGLKDTDNEKVFLTALVVAIILETSERVGNEASASNGHAGITGLKKKQISIYGNKVTLEYTGKSGVEHIKSFSDEKIAKALKLAIKRSKTDDVFCTSDGFKIKADRILRYLSDFSVRSKDLRSIGCNKLMIDRLKNEEIPDDEKKRKKFFMQSLRKVAIKIGHGSGTLRKHYLIPELETNYIKNGNIIDIKERDSYEDGGEIKNNNEFNLTFYRVSAESDSDSRKLYFGNDYKDAKLEYDSANVSDFPSDNGGLVMFQKYTNKYKFVYELDEEFETIEDYPIEDYYNDSDYYKLIEEGEYDDIENRDVKPINKESDDLLMDVENHYKNFYGSYKYNKISVDNEKDEYDDDYKEYGCIQLRIADHSENVKNIDKFGSCDYYISVVIANKNKTHGKFLASVYERRSNEVELSFDSDDSLDDIIYKIDEKIKEGKEYILDKNGIELFEKGGVLSNIEFKCDYEKYFEYVPLYEIENYIEFDREIEHKISKKYLDELTEEIKVNGITYPITLEVDGYKGIIVEGNHRIAVAKRLGIKYIPIRVVLRSRPFKGTIYENKVKELPSRPNMELAKIKYGVSFLDSDNSAAVYCFTKVEPKFSLGGSINRKLTYLGEVGGDKIGQKSSLEKAKSLKKQGISSEEIRQETGWFVNLHDKKWRFEISDEDFDVIQNFSEIKNMFYNDKSLTFVKKNLDEVVRHDKLFAAYPEFRTIPFIFHNDKKDKFVSVCTSKKDKVYIEYNLYDERNRISKSGGLESFRLLRTEKSALRIFDIINEFSRTTTTKDSDRLGDEIYKFRRNILIHELQHIVQIREEFGGGNSPIWWHEELLKRSHINGRPIESYSGGDLHLEAEYFYQNSSGEIESKDVDRRIDFSEEKRKEVIPLSLIRINSNYVTVDLERNYFEKGGELTKSNNFKKWFNGSKVLDEFGKPKIVFHGTNLKFNVFDSKEIGQGTGNFGHYGYGFYFSDDIREAKGYGDIILECYLNIKKPFTGTDEEFDLLKEAGFSGIANKVPLTIDFNDLHEKMKFIDSNAYEFMSIAKEHGIDNVWSIYLESHPHPHNHKIDLNDIYDLLGYTDLFNQNNAVSDYAIEELNSFGIEPKLNYGYQYSQSLHWVTDLGNNSQGFTEFIKSLGYDGVIYGSEYVAFYPNQIKLANGTNTTFDSENPDIRFEYGGEIEKITFDNFHKGTKADFKEIMKAGIPKRKPDFISDSGSKYWFTVNSVIRQSDHWGQLDTCEWTLDGRAGHKITQGICSINNFSK